MGTGLRLGIEPCHHVLSSFLFILDLDNFSISNCIVLVFQMAATSYRFSATPPAIQELPATPGMIRPLSQASTLTPAQVLSQGMAQPMSLQPPVLSVPALSSALSQPMGREMTGPTAILATHGLTPIKTVIRTNPQTGEVAQYIKAQDEMGNKCYVDIAGTPGTTSVSQSMKVPVVEVARSQASQSRHLADLAAMGALATGVVYECGPEGLCTVTRTEGNVPLETRLAFPQGMTSPRMMAGTLPILPLSYVVSEKKNLGATLTALNQKLRESTQTVTSQRLKAETKTLADNTNALVKFQAAREQAIKVLKESEKNIRDLLDRFSKLELKDMTPENMGSLNVVKQELSTRLALEEGLEVMSQKLQSISPLSPELASKATKFTEAVTSHVSAISKPVVPIAAGSTRAAPATAMSALSQVLNE